MMERISRLWIPKRLSSRQRAAENNRSLDPADKGKIASIIGTLKSQEFSKLINDGKITIGVIKPQANEGKNLPPTDEEAANFLLAQIGDRALLKFSLRLTREQAEEFYEPIRGKYTTRLRNEELTIWDSIIDFTISGPLTFVVIYKKDGNAVVSWREEIGHTRGDRADSTSIRGQYAKVENLPNNLVHGSDSIESVKRELQVLIGALQKMLG